MDQKIIDILNKFPFLSYGKLNSTYYLGIIQNSDTQLLSMYVLDIIPTEINRKYFLECGEEWWWESNRQIPINIFLKEKFKLFRPYLRHFCRKDFTLLSGHAVSLQETIAKKSRKRKITFVCKVN